MKDAELDERSFTDSWWHAGDRHQFLEVIAPKILADHGVVLDDRVELALRRWFERVFEANLRGDEDDERRFQLAFLATAVNEAFARRGDPRRVRCLGPAAGSEDPPWYLLTTDEHARALAWAGAQPPGSIEATYDGLESLDALAALPLPQPAPLPEVPVEPPSAVDLHQRDVGRCANELNQLDELYLLRRDAEARASWERAARSWLAGERGRVESRHWRQLADLARKLEIAGATADEIARRAGAAE